MKMKNLYKWGLTLFMIAGFIFGGNANADPETRTTKTGAVFTRDTSHPELGETWKDPKGLLWGDIVKNEDGSVQQRAQSSVYIKEELGKKDSSYMKEISRNFPEGELGAKEYCESIGARLPSREEFTRLREYLGAKPGDPEAKGYSHHDNKILPNLIGSRLGEYYTVWSLTASNLTYPDEYDDKTVSVFEGHDGTFSHFTRYGGIPFRCVIDGR